MRKLAMLRSIQAFEAAARCENYTDAAAELSVTPAAVGQQVRALEAWLGTPLFRRLGFGANRLVLTEAARAALPQLRDGLDKLDAGLQRLRQHRTRSMVTISASQAFVARWLLPRLERFTSQHPQVDVRLDVSDRLVDIEHGEADLAIRCGPGVWGNLNAIKLMDEDVFPACSPALLRGLAHPTTARELAELTLIHDMTATQPGVFPSWAAWLAAHGVEGPATDRGLRINSPAAVLQAALNGHGVALARRAFVADELRSGSLVRLLPEVSWPIPWGYYIVSTARTLDTGAMQAFVNWLIDAARDAAASSHL